MDNNQLLQQLRVLSLEEGRTLIAEKTPTINDHAAFGVQLAEEALNQLYINPATSLKLAELLTFFGDHVHHLSSHALGLKAKGDALRVLGLHQNAIDYLNSAGTEFLQLGDEGNWARSRISSTLATAWLGRVDEALQEANRAREIFIRIGEPYWACMIDSNTALVYEYVGRYQDAYVLYQQMLEVYHSLAEQNDPSIRRAKAIAKCNQAIALAMTGDFEHAYHLQQQARATFIEVNETSCVLNTEENLADLDYMQGYYGSALCHYYDALDMILQTGIDEPPLLASFKLGTARCLMKLNRLQEARLQAEEAVSIQRQLEMSLQRTQALREYATILMALGNPQEALTTLDEAVMLFSYGKLQYYAAITELQQAEVLLAMGNADEAYERAYRLKTFFDMQKLVARSVQATLIMVNALIAMEHPEVSQKAITLAKQAISQARQYNLQEEVYKGYHLLGRLFALQGNFTRAIRFYKAAIMQVERILDSLGFELSPTFLQTTWTLYEEMIALCLRQSQFTSAFSLLERARSTALRQHLHRTKTSQERDVKNMPHYTTESVPETSKHKATLLRLQQHLHQWQERYHQYSTLLADIKMLEAFSLDKTTIEQELTRCETILSDLFERIHLYQATVIFSAQRKKKAPQRYHTDSLTVRQKLGPTQCLLAYFIYQGRLISFVLTRESLVTHEMPEAASQLERLLPLLYAHLQPTGWADISHPPKKAFQHLLQKLYGILIAPVIKMLPPDITSLIVVPYGPLHDLPFHALFDGQQYLIERFEVTYLPASSLLESANRAQDASVSGSVSPAIEHKPPLILGYANNGDAQSILDEAKTLADLLYGKCYTGQAATSKNLLANAVGSSIIHIATHGRMRLDAPHFSSVLLADGQFTAIDAFQLHIKDCSLVTLSGCETGKALIGGGDEQLGLGRAFLAAGAKSLLMSLWPVEDVATTIFMQHFYQSLLSGKTRAEAVRAAQCHLLHNQPGTYTHPYFWAAFRLVGETGTLSIVQKPFSPALDTQVIQKITISY